MANNTQTEEKIIRVGSRKSELALIQTKHVISRLQQNYPNKKFEIHTMSTIGDRVLNISLPKIGEKSLFTRDLEDALRNGGVDFVVHSLKDLPTALPNGMAIGAVLPREDARDALVLRENLKGYTIATLPAGSIIGTSSLRRTAQIRRQYPHLIVCDIRGNLNTRLAKLDANESKFSGIILAQAGLVRMGWTNRINQILEPDDLLYAVGQGALAVECRANDYEILEMLKTLMCLPTTYCILAERSFLKTLGGGCSAPVAVCSQLRRRNSEANELNGNSKDNVEDNELTLSLVGAVWSLDGKIEMREQMSCLLDSDIENGNKTLKRDEKKRSNDVAHLNDEDDESSQDAPPNKRSRSNNGTVTTEPQRNPSPPVINDDVIISSPYSIKELIDKHIDLARKCPAIGHSIEENLTNENNGSLVGAGDANINISDNPNNNIEHCPLPIEVGQDFMGECPFVDQETKISMSSVGKCPFTQQSETKQNASSNSNEDNDIDKVNDEIDCSVQPSTSAKCPFTSLHNKVKVNYTNTNIVKIKDSPHKCPFLQKTVQMFDYADEEKPASRELTIALIDNEKHLFCGLFHHSNFPIDLYDKSNKLGKNLADELIKKGALEVMKEAQTEIHSKV